MMLKDNSLVAIRFNHKGTKGTKSYNLLFVLSVSLWLNAPMEQNKIIELGKRVLRLEAAALKQIEERLDENFARAVIYIAECRGKVICSGMGKAGLIAQKVAATFASTGLPAFFLHPAEAMHGDLGMAGCGDVALLFSNSGESEEVIRLLPHLRSREVYRIALTARRDSSLGRNCELVLEMGIVEEACPLQLAPSSSTTA